MSELKKYSVINTNIKEVKRGNKVFLIKSYKPINMKVYGLKWIKKKTDEYIEGLVNKGVKMPQIQDSFIDKDKIAYIVEKVGENLFDKGFNTFNFKNFEEDMLAILNIFKIVKKNNLYFDPHPKNFVFNNKVVFYVDFFPPYSYEYNEKRVSLSEGEERSIVEKNLSYFKGKYLLPHFCGDFLNINRDFSNIFDWLYELILSVFPDIENFDEFVKIANKIRNTEDIRLERKIYLI